LKANLFKNTLTSNSTLNLHGSPRNINIKRVIPHKKSPDRLKVNVVVKEQFDDHSSDFGGGNNNSGSALL